MMCVFVRDSAYHKPLHLSDIIYVHHWCEGLWLNETLTRVCSVVLSFVCCVYLPPKMLV